MSTNNKDSSTEEIALREKSESLEEIPGKKVATPMVQDQFLKQSLLMKAI